MTAKHTPGPWYALRGQRNISIRHKTGDKFLSMVNVASVRGNLPADCPYGSSEANARLIAAAPELLEALEEAENALADYIPTIERTGASLNYGHSVLKKARAAIAKATGEQT